MHQVFQKPKFTNIVPRIHGKVHYQPDLTFLTRYKKQNSNYHILLNVINVNTKYVYVEALKDKTQASVLDALERIRQKAIKDGRPIKVFQTGSIPSRSRIRLSALNKLSCFFLNELSISFDKGETFSTSATLNLLSFPSTRTEFNPTSSTK